MARYHEADNDEDQEGEDEDYLDDSESPAPDEADDGSAPCPYCGKDKWEDSERCPHCGQYSSSEDTPSQTPRWVIATAVVCLVIVALWILTR
jgi:hypothetical protein